MPKFISDQSKRQSEIKTGDNCFDVDMSCGITSGSGGAIAKFG